jgi:hypothetical protein
MSHFATQRADFGNEPVGSRNSLTSSSTVRHQRKAMYDLTQMDFTIDGIPVPCPRGLEFECQPSITTGFPTTNGTVS